MSRVVPVRGLQLASLAKFAPRAVVDRRASAVMRSVVRRHSPCDGHAPKIEARRAELSARTDDELFPGHTVATHAIRSSVDPPWGALLYQLARRLQARSCVEMGTAVGISGLYLAAALKSVPEGRLVTLEASEKAVGIARQGFAQLGLEDVVDARIGLFSETLERALRDAAPVDLLFVDGHHKEGPTLEYFALAREFLARDAVVVFDDIQINEEMRRAWARIRREPGTRWTLDLVKLGLWAADERRA